MQYENRSVSLSATIPKSFLTCPGGAWFPALETASRYSVPAGNKAAKANMLFWHAIDPSDPANCRIQEQIFPVNRVIIAICMISLEIARSWKALHFFIFLDIYFLFIYDGSSSFCPVRNFTERRPPCKKEISSKSNARIVTDHRTFRQDQRLHSFPVSGWSWFPLLCRSS